MAALHKRKQISHAAPHARQHHRCRAGPSTYMGVGFFGRRRPLPPPSMPSNRPQPAAGHVTPWTSCYAPPPPTRVIVPASAEHQAAHNATRSRDPRATIGHNKNARREGGSGAALPRVAENVPLARVADMTAHQLPTTNKSNNKPAIQRQRARLVTRGLPSIHSPPTPTRVTVTSPR